MYGVDALGLYFALQGLLVKMDVSEKGTGIIFGSILDKSELRELVRFIMEQNPTEEELVQKAQSFQLKHPTQFTVPKAEGGKNEEEP